MVEDKTIAKRIDHIEQLVRGEPDSPALYEAVTLAQTVLHDTVGSKHPLMESFTSTLTSFNRMKMGAACRTLIGLYKQGALRSPILRVAQEVEGEVLAAAETQVRAAEAATDGGLRQMRLAVGAFLAGAALEDALRRLCDKNSARYDAQRSTIAKLQSALYSPSQGVEFISVSDHKQITAWTETRNKADHGRFSDLGAVEVATMVMGIREFVSRALA